MPTKRIRTYPEKQCPTCHTTFAKQGKYCSRACGNSRQFTATYKAKISRGVRQKMIDDPEHKQKIVAAIQPDIPIPPMTESPLGLNEFIQDGDIWHTMED